MDQLNMDQLQNGLWSSPSFIKWRSIRFTFTELTLKNGKLHCSKKSMRLIVRLVGLILIQWFSNCNTCFFLLGTMRHYHVWRYLLCYLQKSPTDTWIWSECMKTSQLCSVETKWTSRIEKSKPNSSFSTEKRTSRYACIEPCNLEQIL